jgi:hypothetical protein
MDGLPTLAGGALSLAGLGLGALKGPGFPQRTVWLIFFLCALADLGGNALYSLGGMYTALFPVLFWTAALYKTTGALALAVGVYAAAHDGNVSSHWYSLPSGCTFLAQLAQFFPAAAVMAGIVGLSSVAVLGGVGGASSSLGKKLAPIALALTAVTVAEDLVGFVVPVAGLFELARGAGVAMVGLMLAGGSLSDVAGKLKKR